MANPIGIPSNPAAAEGPVPLGTLLIYGLPGFVLHFTYMLLLVYPGLCYLVGTICFLRFRLDEATHLAIRRELDARA